MATLQEVISEAREEKFSDQEIWDNLSQNNPRVLEALEKGYTPIQIKENLGLTLSDPEVREVKEVERQERIAPIMKALSKFSDTGESLMYPVKRWPEVYVEEAKEGYDMLNTGMKNIAKSPHSLYQIPLGAARLGFSPLTATMRTGAETVLKRPMEAAGAPEEVAQKVTDAAEIAGDVLIPARFSINLAKRVPKQLPISEEAFADISKRYKGQEFPVEPRVADVYKKRFDTPEHEGYIPPDLYKSGDIKIPRKVMDSYQPQIIDAAKDLLEGKELNKKLFEEIGRLLKIGELTPDHLPEIFQKRAKSYGGSPEELAVEWMRDVSRAGKMLGGLGRMRKDLKKVFKDEPELQKLLEEFDKGKSGVVYTVDRIDDFLRNATNVRRAMLVTQLGTAARNAMTQGVRVSPISLFDEALQTVFKGQPGIRADLNLISSAWHTISKDGRKRFAKVLNNHADGISKSRLLGTPVHEVYFGKVANLMNSFNRVQEFFYRRLGFEAKMRQLLKERGMDYDTINPKNIPDGFYDESIDYALEMSFQATPKSAWMRGIVNQLSRGPLAPLFSTVQPFPRFAANAMRFVVEHSPYGYLKAMSPRALDDLAKGNPKLFARAASRATIGTLMMEAGYWIRNNPDLAGPKWYQVKVGEPNEKGEQRVMDMRAYAPLSTYLFIGELLAGRDPDPNAEEKYPTIDAMDWAQLGIGLNRIAGSGLVFIDVLRTKKFENIKQIMTNLVGAWVGSYTVPIRTPKDIIAGFDEEEAIYREKKTQPFTNYLLSNIPYVAKNLLPEDASPVMTKRMKVEHPWARQVGFSVSTQHPLVAEIQRNGVEPTTVYPRTSVPEADLEMRKIMGEFSEKLYPSLILNPNYVKGTITFKRVCLREFFKAIKNEARKTLRQTHPDLALKVKVEQMKDDDKTLIRGKLGIDLDKLVGLSKE